MINDFFNLIFPRICGSCEQPLLKFEQVICVKCIYQLPKTNSHLLTDNAVEQLFWGRTQLARAMAYYKFEKQGRVQHLIHNLKYRGHTQVGVKVGELYGSALNATQILSMIDLIIPVPLTEKKQLQRGYNQACFFGEGLANALNIPLAESALLRSEGENSQTTKSRFARWENVENKIELNGNIDLRSKNVLLVDDVITTGATIEACARPLLDANCSITVAAMAFSDR